MTDTDYAIRFKLDRAIHHLKLLERLVKSFLRSDANEVINDFTSEPGYLLVKVVSHREPPEILSVLIGEFLYHVRASLDYVACELTRYNQQSVDEDVEFPIFMRGDKFRNPVSGQLTQGVSKRIGRLRADHQAIIEDEQPFQGRYGTPEDDPLAILYRLSNFDRHQFVHVVSTITNASFNTFTPSHLAARFKRLDVQYGAFRSQAVVAKYGILDGPTADVHVQSDVRFNIAFDQEGPGGGRPILKTTADIFIRVGEVIKRLNIP